jgi:pimeloyl-ACP methyl ester carboxylesterase
MNTAAERSSGGAGAGAGGNAGGSAAADGPMVLRFAEQSEHEVSIDVKVGAYERRIACGAAPRVGFAPPEASTSVVRTLEGLGLFTFSSPHAAAGGGKAVLFVPPRHDRALQGPLLVGLHPWNGNIWTYAAYAELLHEAVQRDVPLLMPSGLGNSLYTADAEDEVLRAIDAIGAVVAVDPRRVSLWGASMGGAGATTIGLHHPDRFAGVTSFFGDSKYDTASYVRALLPNDAAAHAVNALDIADNARNVPVWLVHGEDDHVSPIAQSAMLAQALEARHFDVHFERVAHEGHSGALVASRLADVVERAANARALAHPLRVTYKSVRASDLGAYGVRIVRTHPQGDAYVDVEYVAAGSDAARPGRAAGIHVRRATNVRSILLDPDAFGADLAPPAAPSTTSAQPGAPAAATSAPPRDPVTFDDPSAANVDVRVDTTLR